MLVKMEASPNRGETKKYLKPPASFGVDETNNKKSWKGFVSNFSMSQSQGRDWFSTSLFLEMGFRPSVLLHREGSGFLRNMDDLYTMSWNAIWWTCLGNVTGKCNMHECYGEGFPIFFSKAKPLDISFLGIFQVEAKPKTISLTFGHLQVPINHERNIIERC